MNVKLDDTGLNQAYIKVRTCVLEERVRQ